VNSKCDKFPEFGPVYDILEYLASGMSVEDILREGLHFHPLLK